MFYLWKYKTKENVVRVIGNGGGTEEGPFERKLFKKDNKNNSDMFLNLISKDIVDLLRIKSLCYSDEK